MSSPRPLRLINAALTVPSKIGRDTHAVRENEAAEASERLDRTQYINSLRSKRHNMPRSSLHNSSMAIQHTHQSHAVILHAFQRGNRRAMFYVFPRHGTT
jgi:hypothetical protein